MIKGIITIRIPSGAAERQFIERPATLQRVVGRFFEPHRWCHIRVASATDRECAMAHDLKRGILISGSMLYSHLTCPRRVVLDATGPSEAKEEASAFVELLWEGGVLHEKEIVARLGPAVHSLADLGPEEREAKTIQLMREKVPLIHGGRLRVKDLVGEPDLLAYSAADKGYRSGDIKSGSAVDQEGKLRRDYGMQVAHYSRIIDAIGMSDNTGKAFVVDGGLKNVEYDLGAMLGPRTPMSFNDLYERTVEEIRFNLEAPQSCKPALTSACKLCQWQKHCRAELEGSDDLTLIAELGRGKRDAIAKVWPTVQAFSQASDMQFAGKAGKSSIPGIGEEALRKFRDRAILLKTPGAKPYFTKEVNLPDTGLDLHFDVEDDPFSGVCYLHGVLEVQTMGDGSRQQKFHAFLAETPAQERDAFAGIYEFITRKMREGAAMWHFSPYERVTLQRLAKKHEGVCTVEDVQRLFGDSLVVDMYHDLVKSAMLWPTNDLSIKTLAKHLGFSWRDNNPSGAASIEWYSTWQKTRDDAVRDRILQYNEDDVIAMEVVLKACRELRR
jgi:predicted RecB family nuclease